MVGGSGFDAIPKLHHDLVPAKSLTQSGRGPWPSLTKNSTLVRLGSMTHSFDQNQRFVRLAFESTSDGLTVTAPDNGSLAPPGYYMLFLVDVNGVPSVAKIVRLQ
jgi:hypothetical protein